MAPARRGNNAGRAGCDPGTRTAPVFADQVLGGSSTQHDIDSVQNLSQQFRPQVRDSLRQEVPIYGQDLGSVRHRALGQAGRLGGKERVSRRLGPVKVAWSAQSASHSPLGTE